METCTLDLGANPWERLDDGWAKGMMVWGDRPAVPVSVRIRGAHSRRFPKRSLEVRVRRGRVPDAPPEGHEVRRIHLNADYVDPTLIRSALSYCLFEEGEAPAPRCRHAALFLNEEFAGVYMALESVDHDFCRRRGWAPGPVYYGVTRDANFGAASPFTGALKQPLEAGYQDVEQTGVAPLRQMLTEINLASETSFPDVAERWFDVAGYLRWLMVAVFVGNRDGFVHNYALCQDAESLRFRIVPWDYDATWGIDINGKQARVDRVPATGWNKLTHRLLSIPSYRDTYKEAFLAAMEGIFSQGALRTHVDRLTLEIAPWVAMDRNKRGAYGEYAADLDYLHGWADRRREYLDRELQML